MLLEITIQLWSKCFHLLKTKHKASPMLESRFFLVLKGDFTIKKKSFLSEHKVFGFWCFWVNLKVKFGKSPIRMNPSEKLYLRQTEGWGGRLACRIAPPWRRDSRLQLHSSPSLQGRTRPLDYKSQAPPLEPAASSRRPEQRHICTNEVWFDDWWWFDFDRYRETPSRTVGQNSSITKLI